MRLIDVDELIEAIEGHDCLASARGLDTEANAKMEFKKQVLQDIEEQQTIEAEPVRHGHWNGWKGWHWTKKCNDYGDPIYKEHTFYLCSECKRRTVIKSAYCPACGCKMDEASELNRECECKEKSCVTEETVRAVADWMYNMIPKDKTMYNYIFYLKNGKRLLFGVEVLNEVCE